MAIKIKRKDLKYFTDLAVENAMLNRAIDDLIMYCDRDWHFLDYPDNDNIRWLYEKITTLKNKLRDDAQNDNADKTK